MSRLPARAQVSELEDASWRKSSYSGPAGGNCVEMAAVGAGAVAVRDSRLPAGPALVFAAGAWDAFLNRCRPVS